MLFGICFKIYSRPPPSKKNIGWRCRGRGRRRAYETDDWGSRVMSTWEAGILLLSTLLCMSENFHNNSKQTKTK